LSTQVSYSNGNCAIANEMNVIWNTATPTLRICLGNDANENVILELAQNGDAENCNQELDLFLSPVDDTYKNAEFNILPINESIALGAMNSLLLSFNISLIYSQYQTRCGTNPECGGFGNVDYGYITSAIVLSNPKAMQTLFYQIILFDTREPLSCGPKVCGVFRDWFFPTNPYGVSDSIGSYNTPCLQVQSGFELNSYNLDLLPKVLDAIQNSSLGINTDISNWFVGGLYIGGGLNGSTQQTILLADVDLQAN